MTNPPKLRRLPTPSIEIASHPKTAPLDPPDGALTAPPGSAPSAGPDATLIRLCATHTLLQAQIADRFEAWSGMSDTEQKAADAMAYRIEQQQWGRARSDLCPNAH